MFKPVLVANRDAIARRIIRACRALGVRRGAVYSEADAEWPHAREADEAIPIGPAPARESYLNIERVLPGPGGCTHNWSGKEPSMPEEVKAHITGVVFQVLVKPGDPVAAGDPIIVLESMKMEIPVEAPRAGTVAEVRAKEGETVQEGDTVALLE